MNKRTLNIILCVLFLILLLALPVRSLLMSEAPTNARAEGAATFHYILLFLFGSLTLVYGYRAIKSDAAPKS